MNEEGFISLNDIGTQIDTIVNSLQVKYRNFSEISRREKVVIDLYSRIKFNLVAITCIPKEDWAATPLHLLYRSIIADVLEITYLFHISEKEAIFCIDKDNLKAIKYAKDFLNLQFEFFRKYASHESTKQMPPTDELLGRFVKHFPTYINKKGDWQWDVKKINEINDTISDYKGTISSIGEHFKKENIDSELEPIQYLFSLYRILSQTEHYSEIGRKFSYNTDDGYEKMHIRMIHSLIYYANTLILKKVDSANSSI